MVPVPLATDKMIAEIDGAVGWVIFNNPARRNAVSVDMWRAIPAIFDRFEAEPAVRAIVLRGAGEAAFVSGLDISQFEDEFSSSRAAAGLEALSARANRRIQTSSKPTIAMIDGFCIGAGVQIATSCDIRIAADTATLAITAAKLGLGYPVSSLKRLLDIVGPSAVKEIFFTGGRVSATAWSRPRNWRAPCASTAEQSPTTRRSPFRRSSRCSTRRSPPRSSLRPAADWRAIHGPEACRSERAHYRRLQGHRAGDGQVVRRGGRQPRPGRPLGGRLGEGCARDRQRGGRGNAFGGSVGRCGARACGRTFPRRRYS